MAKFGWTKTKQAIAIGVATLMAFTLAACGVGGAEPLGGDTDEAKPAIEFNHKDGDKKVSPDVPAEAEITKGKLTDVEMTNEFGKVVESKISDDGASWTTTETLGYDRTYTIEAKGTTTDGEEITKTITYETATPVATNASWLAPAPDSEVGIGQSINFNFSIAPTDREAVEKAITIDTSNNTEGAFYWVSPYELRWRPKEFWEPGTKVAVKANFYGLNEGDDVYGADNYDTNFTIGEDVRAEVDDKTKTMKVYRNGELLREIPVSLGSDARWPTPNGIYVVGDENVSMVMDSNTFGLSEAEGGYRTTVNYATQLSFSGIYVHGAPWAAGAIGSYNQSHGCINVSESDAAWFQEVVKRGDPVTVKNTVGGTLSAVDGLGQWNMDWNTWKKGNADEN